MTTIHPSGEVPPGPGAVRPILQAVVLDIAAVGEFPAPATRLTGTLEAGTIAGQMRIRTAAGIITVADDGGLDAGSAVMLTLRREAGALVARMQLAPSPARPAVSGAPATADARSSATPPAPFALTMSRQGGEAEPLADRSGPPAAAVTPPGALAARVLLAAAPAVTANETAPTPAADAITRLTTASTLSSQETAVSLPSAERAATHRTAMAAEATPAAVGARLTTLTPTEPTTNVEAHGQPPASRPMSPLDPATLLDLQQSGTEDAALNAAGVVPARAEAAAGTPQQFRLDLDRFARALADLIERQPQLARSLLAAAVPQPNGRLGRTLSAFAAALGHGEPLRFLAGEAYGRLASASPGLVECFATMTGDRLEPAGSDRTGWREVELPLLTPTELLPMRIMVQEKAQDAKDPDPLDAAASGPSRIVVECTFRRFDRVQLDALAHPSQRCEVIVRSASPLPANVQAMVRQAFADASAMTGIAGGVAFQSAPASFVEPAPRLPVRSGLHLSA